MTYRFGYYGLRAVLVLYLTQGLGYSEPTSIAIFRCAPNKRPVDAVAVVDIVGLVVTHTSHSYASAAAYLMSLAGGYVSDTYLGKYKVSHWHSSGSNPS